MIHKSLFVLLPWAGMALADLPRTACTGASKPSVTSEHTARIGGKDIRYSATLGYQSVTAADGKSKACIFYTSYTVASSPPEKRPLTFAFNGGPGSASLWLHMGMLGPRRVDMGPQGLTSPKPLKLVSNADSLLDVSDIVLIDPVGTGFSAPKKGSAREKFFGVKNDYISVAEFIQGFLNDTNRWDSPKYILGESYGGIRGSLLAHYLQSDLGIYLNGLIFISPWLSTTTTSFGETGNDLPYVLFLPSYATSAWYHGKLPKAYQSMRLEKVLQEAGKFARGSYWRALKKGNTLRESDYHAMARRVSEWTGVEQSRVEALDLRISSTEFFDTLLGAQKKRIGRFDSRFVRTRIAAESNPSDPATAALFGPFTAAVNSYLRGELGFKIPSPYIASADIDDWPYDSDARQFGVTAELSQALNVNSDLHVYVASGLYDLATPYETVQFCFAHLARGLDLKNRVTFSRFPSGHMMYIHPPSLAKLKADLVRFYSKTAAF